MTQTNERKIREIILSESIFHIWQKNHKNQQQQQQLEISQLFLSFSLLKKRNKFNGNGNKISQSVSRLSQ
jgi:hypothetical protein